MKDINPLVSVTIQKLNSAKFLEKCLQSIKAQTYPNIEVIVVNGGYVDDPQIIAKKQF